MESALRSRCSAFICAFFSIGMLFTSLSAPAEAQSADENEYPLKLLEVESNVFLGIINWKTLDFQLLEDFETVIDLRYPYEGVYDEMGELRTLGVRHINLPTSSHGAEEKFVSALENAMSSTRGTKTLIHDSNGYRTALLWAAHLVNSGSSAAEALDAVQSIHQGIELQRSIEAYALTASGDGNTSAAASAGRG
jgi:hypothetical protein